MSEPFTGKHLIALGHKPGPWFLKAIKAADEQGVGPAEAAS